MSETGSNRLPYYARSYIAERTLVSTVSSVPTAPWLMIKLWLACGSLGTEKRKTEQSVRVQSLIRMEWCVESVQTTLTP
jgi:hypothetical protein